MYYSVVQHKNGDIDAVALHTNDYNIAYDDHCDAMAKFPKEILATAKLHGVYNEIELACELLTIANNTYQEM